MGGKKDTSVCSNIRSAKINKFILLIITAFHQKRRQVRGYPLRKLNSIGQWIYSFLGIMNKCQDINNAYFIGALMKKVKEMIEVEMQNVYLKCVISVFIQFQSYEVYMSEALLWVDSGSLSSLCVITYVWSRCIYYMHTFPDNIRI